MLILQEMVLKNLEKLQKANPKKEEAKKKPKISHNEVRNNKKNNKQTKRNHNKINQMKKKTKKQKSRDIKKRKTKKTTTAQRRTQASIDRRPTPPAARPAQYQKLAARAHAQCVRASGRPPFDTLRRRRDIDRDKGRWSRWERWWRSWRGGARRPIGPCCMRRVS